MPSRAVGPHLSGRRPFRRPFDPAIRNLCGETKKGSTSDREKGWTEAGDILCRAIRRLFNSYGRADGDFSLADNNCILDSRNAGRH